MFVLLLSVFIYLLLVHNNSPGVSAGAVIELVFIKSIYLPPAPVRLFGGGPPWC